MLTYKCPKCGKTLHSPESEAGQTVGCPDCPNVIRIPAPSKKPLLPGWVWVTLLLVILCIIDLVAITALGSSANKTFQTVGGTVGGQPVVNEKAIQPPPPINKDAKD